MTAALFSIKTHVFNTESPTAVQLFGGPLGTIVALTIFRNSEDVTFGVLPKGLAIATLFARPSEFDDLVEKLNGGGNHFLAIHYELVNNKRSVTQIETFATASTVSSASNESSRAVDDDADAAEEAGCGASLAPSARFGGSTPLAWLGGIALGLLWVRRRKVRVSAPSSSEASERRR
jgi:hypothetical protein